MILNIILKCAECRTGALDFTYEIKGGILVLKVTPCDCEETGRRFDKCDSCNKIIAKEVVVAFGDEKTDRVDYRMCHDCISKGKEVVNFSQEDIQTSRK